MAKPYITAADAKSGGGVHRAKRRSLLAEMTATVNQQERNYRWFRYRTSPLP